MSDFDPPKCPGCGTPNSVPCGYHMCRSCTFGWDSLEGRVSRAYLPGGGGLAEEERVIAERDEVHRG